MRVSFYFERSCPEHRPPAARCIEAARAPSPARAGPGPRAPPPPPRSSRVADSWSWSRGKWQAAGAISVVGKAVLTLYPPPRPLSHNVRPPGRGPRPKILLTGAAIYLPFYFHIAGKCGLQGRQLASSHIFSSMCLPSGVGSDLTDGTTNKLVGSYHERLCELVPSLHKEGAPANTLLFIGYWCVYIAFTVANLDAYKNPARQEATRQWEVLARRNNASMKALGCLEALNQAATCRPVNSQGAERSGGRSEQQTDQGRDEAQTPGH
jgi:hypothetical protein